MSCEIFQDSVYSRIVLRGSYCPSCSNFFRSTKSTKNYTKNTKNLQFFNSTGAGTERCRQIVRYADGPKIGKEISHSLP